MFALQLENVHWQWLYQLPHNLLVLDSVSFSVFLWSFVSRCYCQEAVKWAHFVLSPHIIRYTVLGYIVRWLWLFIDGAIEFNAKKFFSHETWHFGHFIETKPEDKSHKRSKCEATIPRISVLFFYCNSQTRSVFFGVCRRLSNEWHIIDVILFDFDSFFQKKKTCWIVIDSRRVAFSSAFECLVV